MELAAWLRCVPDSGPATNHRRSGKPSVSQEFPAVLPCFLHEMFLPQRIVNGVMVLASCSRRIDRLARIIIASGEFEGKALRTERPIGQAG